MLSRAHKSDRLLGRIRRESLKYLYERIYEDYSRQILEGELRPGERLPSARETAALYGCNKLTAVKAFELLRQRGLVENIVGSGSYVAWPEPESEEGTDFAASVLSEDFFPYEAAGALFADELKRERGRVFSAAPLRGDDALLRALASLWSLETSRLWIGSGGQQALDAAARLFGLSAHSGASPATHSARHAGADILVEDPTYPAALPLFRPSGSIPMREGGVDSKDFADFWSSRPGRSESTMRIFYTVPDLHNPTGFRYSLETKRGIAALARRHDVWIIEDDHLSELEPSGIPRFLDLVPERTLWMKSLSKTTAPGIRICATSLPETLAGRYALLRSESDPGPPLWLQLFAGRFLASDLYPAHIARIRQTAASRRASLIDLIKTFPSLSIRGGDSGYALWLGYTAKDSTGSHIDPPAQHRPWTEGARFGASASTRSCFRLSFMGIPEATWPRALARLSGALSLIDAARGL